MKRSQSSSDGEETRHIKMGFIIISIIFSVLVIVLFYFMIHFRNNLIQFSQQEAVGSKSIGSIIGELDATPLALEPFKKRIEFLRNTGDQSNLILDPDLDSYYIMNITINILPKIFTHLLELELASDRVQAYARLKPLLQEDLNEFNRSLIVALHEDGNFYSVAPALYSKEFTESSKLFTVAMTAILEKPDAYKSSPKWPDLFKTWGTFNNVLSELLKIRIQKLQAQKDFAITLTLVSWILCIVFVVYFTRYILKKQIQLNERIKQQNLALVVSSKMSVLGEMTGGLAHEINTPLAAVRLNSEALKSAIEENTEKEEIFEKISTIIKITDHISGIIASVKNLSQDRSADSYKTVSIKPILNDTLALCNDIITRKNIKLKVDIQSDMEFECNPVEILQVFLNLVKNSIDAIETLEEKWIRVQAHFADNSIVVSFTDSGPGISEEIRHKIFDSFFTTKVSGGGTGLGLGISRNILEKHKGSLALNSGGSHTCFVVSLPLKRQQIGAA